MQTKSHYDEFEREMKFHEILAQARCTTPSISAKTVKEIIGSVCCDFLVGLFDVKPCVRKLKYVGNSKENNDSDNDKSFFKIGQIYESVNFTGATYLIKGYDQKRRIGSAYFERVD